MTLSVIHHRQNHLESTRENISIMHILNYFSQRTHKHFNYL
jgi:hypothetical protein